MFFGIKSFSFMQWFVGISENTSRSIEAIFKSDQIKEQHVTMKLQDEEFMLKNT